MKRQDEANDFTVPCSRVLLLSAVRHVTWLPFFPPQTLVAMKISRIMRTYTNQPKLSSLYLLVNSGVVATCSKKFIYPYLYGLPVMMVAITSCRDVCHYPGLAWSGAPMIRSKFLFNELLLLWLYVRTYVRTSITCIIIFAFSSRPRALMGFEK